VAWTQFVAEIYERFDTDTHHLGLLTKLKQSGTVEDFIAAFEHLDFCTEGMSDDFFSENALSMDSRMRFVPTSSWLTPRVGWKLLKELRKHNKLSLLKPKNPLLFPTLNLSLPPLLLLH
jgi:hypothetical protein